MARSAWRAGRRFTFRSPAQATAYFCGYTKCSRCGTRRSTSCALASTPRAFRDLILSQGLLPPDLMRKAVLAELQGFAGTSNAASSRRLDLRYVRLR